MPKNDESYQHDNTDTSVKEKYLIKAGVRIEDVDWPATFDLFLTNDFFEGEIRIKESAAFIAPQIKSKNQGGYQKVANLKRKQNKLSHEF